MNKQEIEKAIKILNHKNFGFSNIPEYEALNLAISALEQQLTNGWIPVSDKPPAKHEEVMACNKDGLITIGYIRKREGYYTCEHLPFVTEDIVAWQPLPEPYKEVSE